MKRKYMQRLSALLAFVVLFFSHSAISAEWYKGGTLHAANGLEWQSADYANKLATAGDLVAAVYQREKLIPQLSSTIKGVSDIKPLAAALVEEMDDAFAPDSDTEKNKRMFINQKVADTAVILMVAAGWIK